MRRVSGRIGSLVAVACILASVATISPAPAAINAYPCVATGWVSAYDVSATPPYTWHMELHGVCIQPRGTYGVRVSGGASGLFTGSAEQITSRFFVSTVVTATGGKETAFGQVWDLVSPSYVTGRPSPVGPYLVLIYGSYACPSPGCDTRGNLNGTGLVVSRFPTSAGGVKTWRVAVGFAFASLKGL